MYRTHRCSVHVAAIYPCMATAHNVFNVQPIAECVSVVWHSALTAEQAADLEAQQTQAMRQIYGYGLSAGKKLEKSGLERLSKRREKADMLKVRFETL